MNLAARSGSLCGQSAPQGEDTQEDDFSDEMIVMAGFSGQMLNAFLHSFYTYHLAPVSLKAVLTEVNAQFTGPTPTSGAVRRARGNTAGYAGKCPAWRWLKRG